MNKRDLKAYVRLDYSGRSVPGSLVVRKTKPKVGKWVEVEASQCCNGTTTTTTSSTTAAPSCVTYFISVGRSGGILEYIDCSDMIHLVPMGPYESDTFCARENTAFFSGDGIIFLISTECLVTTTTTSTTCNPLSCDYGLLYNFYAVDTDKLAPTGYHVPTNAEFETLRLYVASQGWNYDGTTDAGTLGSNKQAKSLCSVCKWDYYSGTGVVGNTDYPDKRNISGFSAIPAGYRSGLQFRDSGYYCSFWTSTESNLTTALHIFIESDGADLDGSTWSKSLGFSVRCLRDTSEGWEEGEQMEDYDGNLYDTVQIGTQIWTVQNLKTTHYNDGEAIPNVEDGTAWGLLTTGAGCAYNNDWETYACVPEPTTTTTTTLPE